MGLRESILHVAYDLCLSTVSKNRHPVQSIPYHMPDILSSLSISQFYPRSVLTYENMGNDSLCRTTVYADSDMKARDFFARISLHTPLR